ncbi:MAG: trypsin-like peptidase domain-containing protein [Acholeplasmataceae bacterium]
MKKTLLILNSFLLFLLSGCVTIDLSFTQEAAPADAIDYQSGAERLETFTYPELINSLSLTTMKANVTVYTTSYTSARVFGSTQFGSGVLFHYDDPFYYLLTNQHVIDFEDGHERRSFEIEDFQGNAYEGRLYQNSDVESLDLAILYFAKEQVDLHVVPLALDNPETDSEVIAIGQPDFQKNALTFGIVEDYEQISPEDMRELAFESIVHDATINPGSSGGMLINTNQELVGINFASSDSEDNGEYYAIPVETIIDYLTPYRDAE